MEIKLVNFASGGAIEREEFIFNQIKKLKDQALPKKSILYFGGLAHGMIRPAERRNQWQSLAELLSNESREFTIFTICELRYKALHHCGSYEQPAKVSNGFWPKEEFKDLAGEILCEWGNPMIGNLKNSTDDWDCLFVDKS